MRHYKPDFTAWFVLQGTIAAMHRPDFYDESNQKILDLYLPLSKAASKTRPISRLISCLPYGLQYTIGELVTSPGRLRHFYFRKKEIEKQTRRLIEEEGLSQVIILGAGLDVLSIRLAKEYPDIHFVEIDTIESQQFKKSALEVGRIDVPDNLELIAGDLRDPLEGILKNSSLYDATKKTLWLAEGFLMFIPEESVIRLLTDIKALSVGGAYVLFTSLPDGKQGTSFGKIIQGFYLKKENSPLKWLIPYESVGSFLAEIDLELVFQLSCEQLQTEHIGSEYVINHVFADNIHIAKT